jgi:hypothetical protein
MCIAESSRPESVTKATNDIKDIMKLLQWLSQRSMTIDFSAYPEKPKDDLLPGFRLLLQRGGPRINDLLKMTLEPADFLQIK